MAGLFPVASDKTPMMEGWPALASFDPAQLARWRRQYRNRHWGLSLAGLVAIDFDHLRGKREVVACSEGGFAPEAMPNSFAAFMAEFGAGSLPMLAMWRESPNGLHVVMRAPDDLRSRNRFRPNVDLKCGAGSLIVFDGPGYQQVGGLADLDHLPMVPDGLAKAFRDCASLGASRLTSGNSFSSMPDRWDALAAATRSYRASAKTARLLLDDCDWLAGAEDGRQWQALNGLGLKWGERVARKFISAERVLTALVNAAMNMPNYRPREPWTRRDVERRLRVAIADGAAGKRP